MQWINDETLQAICRTFLHSLWQGMIAAILAGLVLAFTRRTAARTRYNLLGGILLLSFLAAGFTFYLESGARPATSPAPDQYVIFATPSATSSTMHPGDILLQYMNAHAGLIMLMWLIVFMVKCCRLMNGFLHIRRIRQEALPVAAGWNEQMLRLSRQLGISKTVQLLETARAQVPFTRFYKAMHLHSTRIAGATAGRPGGDHPPARAGAYPPEGLPRQHPAKHFRYGLLLQPCHTLDLCAPARRKGGLLR